MEHLARVIKQKQRGKKTQNSLFADEINIYIGNHTHTHTHTHTHILDLINVTSGWYRIQKSIVFLYASNEHVKTKI